MTENAFYPIFMWLAYVLVRALEEPTRRRQVVLLAVCALAFLTRAQAVALVAAALLAPLVLAWIERGRPRRLAAWKPLYGVVALGAVGVVAVQLARGQSPSEILGGYSVTTGAGYDPWDALRWVLYHAAALDLSLFVLPFAAFLVLVASARHLDRPLRVFCAAAVSLVVLLTIEVGIFASEWALRIEERNLFYVAPLFLVALLAWIERGQPRPSRAIVAAAVAAAALPAALPFTSLMNINSQSDTPFLQPWWYLGDRLAGRDNVALVVALVALALAAAFLWLPARYAPALPALVAAGFLVTWLPLQLWIHSFARLSTAAYLTGIGEPRSWVDRAVPADADVTLVHTGDNPYRGWENEFWNRSVRRVYDYAAPPLMAGVGEEQLTVEHATGRFLDPAGRPVRVQYVLADRNLQIAGTRVAVDAGRGMAVYHVDGVLRTEASVDGWYDDTWTGASFSWRRRDCTPGELRLPIRTSAGVAQRVAVTGDVAKPFAVTFPSESSRTVVVPVRPVQGVCTVRFAVSPPRTPPADPRTLGVLVGGFDYVPRDAG